MKTRLHLRTLRVIVGMPFLLCMAYRGSVTAAQERGTLHVDPRAVHFEATPSGLQPCPFQATRCLLSLTNPGGTVQRSTAYLDWYVHCIRVRLPDGRVVSTLDSDPIPLKEPDEVTGPLRQLEDKECSTIMLLKPGERIAVSLAIAATWNSPGAFDGNSIFPGPGQSVVTWQYGHGSDALTAESPITVREPTADEKPIVQRLAKDRDLASVLLCPLSFPGPALRPVLKELATQQPATSFSDYAHFALARAYLRGGGYALRGQRGIDRSHIYELAHPPGTREILTMLVEQQLGGPPYSVRSGIKSTPLRGAQPYSAWDEEITKLINAQAGGDAEKRAAVEHFVDLLEVNKDDLAAGIAELKAIKSKDFPYMPNVLALLHVAVVDQNERKAIRERMIAEYPDAFETLETVAPYIPAENWLAFRVHKMPATRPAHNN